MGIKIGFVGLGAMGGSIAGRLIAEGDVTVTDLNTAAVDRLVAQGAKAGTLAEVGEADVVVLSLPSDAAVLSVGKDLAKHVKASTVIEMSTVLPDTAKKLRALMPGVDEFVDAPVSGGPADASGGTLSLLVGVEKDLSDNATRVLSAVGTINVVGGIGSGKAVKLVNNMMAMGNVAVAVEAFQLGIELGVEPTALYDVLSRSGGRSNHFNKRIPWVIDDDFTARFAVRLGEKDLRLAIEVAHELKYATPIAATIHQLYEAGITRDLADEDVVSLIKLYRK